MGDRYFITIICPDCGYIEEDIYYAPTCGFVDWNCAKCRKRIDLSEYTGISREDASNRDKIEKLIADMKISKEEQNGINK